MNNTETFFSIFLQSGCSILPQCSFNKRSDGLKSKATCQQGEFIQPVQLCLPAIVQHWTKSNNQIWTVTQTHIHTSHPETGKSKHQTLPCFFWHSDNTGMSWYNTKCPKRTIMLQSPFLSSSINTTTCMHYRISITNCASCSVTNFLQQS